MGVLLKNISYLLLIQIGPNNAEGKNLLHFKFTQCSLLWLIWDGITSHSKIAINSMPIFRNATI